MLWRRFNPRWVTDDGKGGQRASSVAFRHGDAHEISVNVARLADFDRLIQTYPRDALAEVLARIPREKRYTVLLVPEEGNPGHAEVWPPDDMTGIGKRACSEHMARNSTVIYLGGQAAEPV
jgi:hypothetical protein